MTQSLPKQTTRAFFSHAAPEGAAKKTSEVLGEIVWLMSQSQIHKRMFIQDLEWPVASATKHGVAKATKGTC